MLYNAALVLEGGAFRGQYTAGIVDTFLAHHIEFRSVIGVSAGSLCGVNFVSKQYGRAANINIDHRHDRQYISMARVFKKQIINLDYLLKITDILGRILMKLHIDGQHLISQQLLLL